MRSTLLTPTCSPRSWETGTGEPCPWIGSPRDIGLARTRGQIDFDQVFVRRQFGKRAPCVLKRGDGKRIDPLLVLRISTNQAVAVIHVKRKECTRIFTTGAIAALEPDQESASTANCQPVLLTRAAVDLGQF